MGTEKYNRAVWDGRSAEHVENWQLALHHRATNAGYLLRCDISVPLPQVGAPEARVRVARFDAERPQTNLAVSRGTPIDAGILQSAREEGWRLELEGMSLAHDAVAGEIAGDSRSVRWDLRFEPALQPHHYLPEIGYAYADYPPLKVVSPNPSIYVSGRIEIGGEVVEVSGDPGCQTHAWGRSHLSAWAMAHCNAFREDATASLQVLSFRPADGWLFGALPRVTPVAVYLGGEVYDFCALPQLLLARGYWETGLFRFAASGHHVKLEGEARARPEDFVRLDLTQPDGRPAYSHLTEVADAVVTVWTRRSRFSRFRQLCRLTSRSAAHLEYGGRAPDPNVDRRDEAVDALDPAPSSAWYG